MTTNLEELEGLLTEIGTLPLSESWMSRAIRHCQRDLEFDVEDGGNEPERYAGTALAKLANRLPTLLSERTAMQARIAELVEGLRTTLISLEWWQRNEPDSFGNIERNALDLAKSLLTPLVEKG